MEEEKKLISQAFEASTVVKAYTKPSQQMAMHIYLLFKFSMQENVNGRLLCNVYLGNVRRAQLAIFANNGLLAAAM